MTYTRTFGRTISLLRAEKNWTVKEAARRIGIPFSTYAGYENSSKEPRFEKVLKMAQVFNTSTDYLLGVTEEKRPKVITNDLEQLLELKDFKYKGKPLSNRDLKLVNDFLTRIAELQK